LGLFITFVFYAGLGIFRLTDINTETIWYVLPYLGLLYLMFYRAFDDNRLTVILIALSIFVGQLLINYVFPQVQGYSGWLAFGFILGNFLGIFHPPAEIEQPLDTKRKILGWVSLLIFLLSFSPEPFIVK
jgi:hypothetical protein